MNFLFRFVVSFWILLGCSAHECYVCHQQDHNTGKCTETVEPCNYTQDHCLSEVHWGSTPYWEIGAPKQFYINKKCADKAECDATISRFMPLCDRIWWTDWSCAECCKGDRCNYYITLGSSSVTSSALAVLLAVATSCLVQLLLRA